MFALTAFLLALPAAQVRPEPPAARPDRAAPPACERCDPGAARTADRPRFRPAPFGRPPFARRQFEHRQIERPQSERPKSERPFAPRLRRWMLADPQLREEVRAEVRARVREHLQERARAGAVRPPREELRRRFDRAEPIERPERRDPSERSRAADRPRLRT